MKFVKQENCWDCGLAAAAMLAGKTLKDANAADPNPDKRGGLSLSDLKSCLVAMTGRKIKVSKPTPVPLSTFTMKSACILLIREHGKKHGHYVAQEEGTVFDSDQDGPLSVFDHPYRDWLVIRVIDFARP